MYSGSNNFDEVGWYEFNSVGRTHPVAQKKANGYGLYDMSGNVCEWCWDFCQDKSFRNSFERYYRGGNYNSNGYHFMDKYGNASLQYGGMGFRIVCSAFN